MFPNFQHCARCENDLKDNKDNSLHLGSKYVRIFVLGHYLFLVTHMIRPRKTVRLSEQIMSADKYPSIFSRQMAAIIYLFSPQMEAIVFIILQTRAVLKIGEYLTIIHLSIAALFSSPHGYLGQLVLLYIFANLYCLLLL